MVMCTKNDNQWVKNVQTSCLKQAIPPFLNDLLLWKAQGAQEVW